MSETPEVAKVVVATGPEHEMFARVYIEKQSLISHMKQYVVSLIERQGPVRIRADGENTLQRLILDTIDVVKAEHPEYVNDIDLKAVKSESPWANRAESVIRRFKEQLRILNRDY